MQERIEDRAPRPPQIVIVFDDLVRIQQRNRAEQMRRKLAQQNALQTTLGHATIVATERNDDAIGAGRCELIDRDRSEEHTSELQSLMRISYAVFCLKKKKERYTKTQYTKQELNKEERQQRHTRNK